jgi:FkbM family methyltransferase
VLRLPLLRLLERIAGLLRRFGLGAFVDRVRGRALRGLGEFTERVDGVTLCGDVALHSHYVRALKETDREQATAQLFADSVKEGSVVLDIGAHLGYFTALAATRGATVLAFEPNRSTLPYLRRTLELNGVADRVRVVERAAGAKEGTATFFRTGAGDESSLHRPGPDAERVTVEVGPVDAETSGLVVDVIKLDVEGGELEALAGMARTLERASPELVLFVERNSGALRRAGHAPEELDQALRAHGFDPRPLDEEAEGAYVNLVCRRAWRGSSTAR